MVYVYGMWCGSSSSCGGEAVSVLFYPLNFLVISYYFVFCIFFLKLNKHLRFIFYDKWHLIQLRAMIRSTS